MSDELVNWLRAQLDLDQAWALKLPSESGSQVFNGSEWVPMLLGARVLREVEALRSIIDAVMSWKHAVVEDCWYTCPAATEEHDGGESCNDNRLDQGRCDCGLDRRRLAILAPLAAIFSDRPGYQEAWRPA